MTPIIRNEYLYHIFILEIGSLTLLNRYGPFFGRLPDACQLRLLRLRGRETYSQLTR